jgi:hypothetical protein
LLYEKGRVLHRRGLDQLEAEMMAFSSWSWWRRVRGAARHSEKPECDSARRRWPLTLFEASPSQVITKDRPEAWARCRDAGPTPPEPA